jgi:hypothetical protein
MSSGPSITVYDLTKKRLREYSNEIKSLMLEIKLGTRKEREYVANYLNDSLLSSVVGGDPAMYLFSYWNFGPDQEVDDYDKLCKMFGEYGKILSSLASCICIVSSTYGDHRIFCQEDRFYILKDKDENSLDEYIEKLQLKSAITKGKDAEKKIKELDKDKKKDEKNNE